MGQTINLYIIYWLRLYRYSAVQVNGLIINVLSFLDIVCGGAFFVIPNNGTKLSDTTLLIVLILS